MSSEGSLPLPRPPPCSLSFCSLWQKFLLTNFLRASRRKQSKAKYKQQPEDAASRRGAGACPVGEGEVAAHCPCGACYAPEQRRWQGECALLRPASTRLALPCLVVESFPFILVTRYLPLFLCLSLVVRAAAFVVAAAARIYYYFYIVINHS